MRVNLKQTEGIFPMPVLMVATYNEDSKINMSLVNAIAFDPYTHGYYKIGERVGEAFHDGLQLKK